MCERACAEVGASPLVRYQLAIGERKRWLVCFLLVFEGGEWEAGHVGAEKMVVSQAADVSPLVWL